MGKKDKDLKTKSSRKSSSSSSSSSSNSNSKKSQGSRDPRLNNKRSKNPTLLLTKNFKDYLFSLMIRWEIDILIKSNTLTHNLH